MLILLYAESKFYIYLYSYLILLSLFMLEFLQHVSANYVGWEFSEWMVFYSPK